MSLGGGLVAVLSEMGDAARGVFRGVQGILTDALEEPAHAVEPSHHRASSADVEQRKNKIRRRRCKQIQVCGELFIVFMKLYKVL
jgi:hypothetical protein